MKRITAACLLQTVYFQLKEDVVGHEAAVRAVQHEVQLYKSHLERKRIRYVILGEETQPDGSVIMQIKKQVNEYPCGDYLK